MKRALTDNEIHALLEQENYGHLACCESATKPYLVPVTYVYHENAVYSFAFVGKKIEIMRKHPHVCFQIERLQAPNGWRSAMVRGTFEELSGKDRDSAMALILERLWRESTRGHPLFLPFRNSTKTLEQSKDDKNFVLYRIVIKEKSGRVEEYEEG